MDVRNIFKTFNKIKIVFLIFFCVALTQGCGFGNQVQIEQIDYENEKAVGVTFSTKMDVENLRVFIGNESQTSVIGVIVSVKERHSFTPVIPFSPGETYTFRKMDTVVLASFTIPKREVTALNEVLGLYPQVDTVPENLLKMYLEFAQPMQEVGNALDFIKVTNETDGTEQTPFLRLESELWNKEHTVLTLWLDPGRIKTELIPNKERGLPLTAGKMYTVHIDSSWKSRQGDPLKQIYTKTFHVGMRDDKKPNVKDWQLRVQDADTIKKLYIDFGEPMDAYLAKETMRVYDSKASEIAGSYTLQHNESIVVFNPIHKWKTGNYKLLIESRLEDLAGNNLSRLFDTDLEKITAKEVGGSTRSIPFTIN